MLCGSLDLSLRRALPKAKTGFLTVVHFPIPGEKHFGHFAAFCDWPVFSFSGSSFFHVSKFVLFNLIGQNFTNWRCRFRDVCWPVSPWPMTKARPGWRGGADRICPLPQVSSRKCAMRMRMPPKPSSGRRPCYTIRPSRLRVTGFRFRCGTLTRGLLCSSVVETENMHLHH